MAFSVLVENDLFPVVHLLDVESNCTAEVYSFGALLNAFTITKAGTGYNVIDGFSSPQQARDTVTAGFKSAKLSPFVCRVAGGKYIYNGEALLIDKFYMGEEAIHGLLFDAPFAIIDKGADSDAAFVVLAYDYDKNDKGFPFKYNTQITYTLKKDGVLEISTVVTNTGVTDMPLADGWHPYFTLGGSINDLTVQIIAAQMLEFNGKLVPTGNVIDFAAFSSPQRFGETFFDNCFVISDSSKPAFTIKNETTGLQLSIMAITGYPYLQIYTPPHRKSIAVENLSSAPDAFNNGIGLIIAKPHEQHIFTASYTVQFEHN